MISILLLNLFPIIYSKQPITLEASNTLSIQWFVQNYATLTLCIIEVLFTIYKSNLDVRLIVVHSVGSKVVNIQYTIAKILELFYIFGSQKAIRLSPVTENWFACVKRLSMSRLILQNIWEKNRMFHANAINVTRLFELEEY